MRGIPPHILNPLRAALIQCPPFSDTAELQALFDTDDRITLWLSHLPDVDGTSRIARVEIIIDYLVRQSNQDGDNGLVLFIQVLSDELDQQDAARQQFIDLAQELDTWSAENPSVESFTMLAEVGDNGKIQIPREQISTGESHQILYFDHFKVILWMKQTTWTLQVENISRETLKRMIIGLHPSAALWVNPQQFNIGNLDAHATSAEIPFSISVKQTSSACELGIEANYLVSGIHKPLRTRKSLQLLL